MNTIQYLEILLDDNKRLNRLVNDLHHRLLELEKAEEKRIKSAEAAERFEKLAYGAPPYDWEGW